MAMLYLRNKPIGAISSGSGGGSYTEGDGIDITNNEISVDTAFTEASTRANIASGDSFSTILGKIKKWFTDLPSMFVSKSGDTMTGPLQIAGASGYPLTLNRTSGTVWIDFQNSGTDIGLIGVMTDKKPYFYDTSLHRIPLWDDLLLNYATPFYSPNVQAGHIRFTFTGLGQYESVHLLIFTRRCAGDLLLECSSTGFSSITKGLLVDNGSGYNLGFSYNPNNGYTVKVQIGEWSSAWGIFVHPNFPNATMTMTRES